MSRRLLLISPRADFFGKNPGHRAFKKECREFQFFDYTWTGFTTGLLIVASVTPAHFDIQYVDENVEPIDFDADVDLVALTGMTAQATRMLEIADRFRARGVPVVAGGLFTTAAPELVAPHVDAVCVGEAEAIWPRVIDDFERGELKPVYRQHAPAAARPGPRGSTGLSLVREQQQVDLRTAPRPRYDLAQRDYYPSIWIETSRGCQHRCGFCASTISYRDKLGWKSIEQVVDEIKHVCERWNNPYILFSDDNFAANRKRTKELLRQLVPLGIKWSAQTDISYSDDDELLKLMHQSGCMMMLSGFESVSDEGLTNIDLRNFKRKRLAGYAESIKRVQDHGIGVYGSFTLGLDTDTLDIFDQTWEFVRQNLLAGIQVSSVTPFPGTPFYKQLQAEGRILPDKPWSYYTVFDCVVRPKNMTPEELDAGCLKVYRNFYSRDFSLTKTRHFKQIYTRLVREKMSRDGKQDALATSGRVMV